MARRTALVFLGILAIAGGVLAPDRADARTMKRTQSRTAGKVEVGVDGSFWLESTCAVSAKGSTNSADQDFSGSASVFAEYYLLDYLAVGGMLDITAMAPKSHGGADDIMPVIGILALARAGYPMGPTGAFEPFLRFGVGYGAFVPPKSAPSSVDAEHGWVVKVLPGFQYNTSFGLGAFVEIGWAGSGFNKKLGGVDSRVTYHSAVINLGVAYRF